ncbi:MAG: PhoX family phosphatase [Alcanivorax sp.]|nr:MAG: PhoX family phosphatase [Alcanivorax sp.]
MKKMRQQHEQFHRDLEAQGDVSVNSSANPSLDDVIRLRRRGFLKGSLALAVSGFMGGSLSGCASGGGTTSQGFKAVPIQTGEDFDTVVVPPGYTARPFFSWGDAVLADASAWRADAGNSWQDQLKQAGQNNDGMHFFPFPDNPNGRGLLVVNHEYVNPTLHRDGFDLIDGKRPLEQVRKEQAAHGVSVIEIAKDPAGQWQRVVPSRWNRRVSNLTEMEIRGPLAGHDLMKTVDDPAGKTVIGTLNNCSMGYTPWGTYLACEENWHDYFVNRDSSDRRTSHRRYGILDGERADKYAWNTAEPRFDATADRGQPFGGHVQEPHRFGWVVEIDPFDPDSRPIKRTAFGRFCREGCTASLGDDGRMAFYSGDDSRGEYLYKFVPEGRYIEGDREHNRHLLDSGTLYVARFDGDGRGVWLPLVHGENGLTRANGFADQGEVLVNARAAADRLGATPMDRPEWVAVDPNNREVYATLTNNHKRGHAHPINAANPRHDNHHGQIIRWREQGADVTATRFTWDLFLLAGEAQGGHPDHLTGTINGDIFSSPDGLAFDAAGRLWIETDYDDRDPLMQNMGCNQLLCADPRSREVRRFLVGPRGCEITGITFTPDQRTLWVNIQHPKISYPASDGETRPRSTTVMITKEDGGVIGT